MCGNTVGYRTSLTAYCGLFHILIPFIKIRLGGLQGLEQQLAQFRH